MTASVMFLVMQSFHSFPLSSSSGARLPLILQSYHGHDLCSHHAVLLPAGGVGECVGGGGGHQ